MDSLTQEAFVLITTDRLYTVPTRRVKRAVLRGAWLAFRVLQPLACAACWYCVLVVALNSLKGPTAERNCARGDFSPHPQRNGQ